MKHSVCLITFALAIFATLAAATDVPPGWNPLRRAVLDTDEHTFLVSLKQQNLDRLTELAYAVSDPRDPAYGRHWSTEAIGRLVSPPQDVIKSVVEFFESHGATRVSVHLHGDVLTVHMPVHAIQRTLGVQMGWWAHEELGRLRLRSRDEPRVSNPEIAQHIEMFHKINELPPRAQRLPKLSNGKEMSFDEMKEKLNQYNSEKPTGVRVAFGSCENNNIQLILQPDDCDFTDTTDKLCFGPEVTIDDFQVYVEFPDANAPYTYNSTVQLNSQYSMCSSATYTWYGYTSSGPSYRVNCAVSFPVHLKFEYELLRIGVRLSPSTYGYSEFQYLDGPVVCTPNVVPQDVFDLYSIPRGTTVTNNSTQCVVEFEQQYYSPEDLEEFFALMGMQNNENVVTVGPNDATQPGGEAALDIEWIMAMGQGAKTWFWSHGADSSLEVDDILGWAYDFGNTTGEVPLVNSLSYGMVSENVDRYLGTGYLRRSNTEFKKLALRGITLIIADGDTGANDLGGLPMGFRYCDAKGRTRADWPSESNYVTAVSASYITPNDVPACFETRELGLECSSSSLGEVAVGIEMGNFWNTGGGFAISEPRMAYQDSAYKRFMDAQGDAMAPLAGSYNSSNRIYPDVSAVGHYLEVVLGGELIPISGTSASAPIFAGIVTLLNDARLGAGQAPLGWLNPALYLMAEEHPEVFNDISVGSNNCGAYSLFDSDVCCEVGFQAGPSFDPVTGNGSVNFEEMLKQVLALGASTTSVSA